MGPRPGHPHHRHGRGGGEGHSLCIAEARRVVGMEPTYFTFDIDSIDPAFAPGTGTPEIGGFTSREALQLVRGFRHLNSSVRTWWKSRRRSTNPAARRWSARPSPSSCFASRRGAQRARRSHAVQLDVA